jgi:hypothetical protein
LNVLILNDYLSLIKDNVLETLFDPSLNELRSGLVPNHGDQEFVRKHFFVGLLKGFFQGLVLLRVELLNLFQFLLVNLLKGLAKIQLLSAVVAIG